ncbi:hypothetical protein NUH86_10880 [Sphingobium sp. JS3065]|uniref:hypothetical protein n=1 Tax=Sphingobium sp. JS3065 TaxID=2970925 RepID=UPI002264A91E|nr:hypothetical protein [Sphingobium sp. JS3065]UZW54039.1 hypothetical protein NUH86_10880 [Sphingobium sp. JS3065]
MSALYIRARLVNAYRRIFPHPAVVAMRERRRVASKAAISAKRREHTAIMETAARLRGEAQDR